MRPFHILLGILTAAIWGFNFVVLKVALVDVPPILLTALRFILSCLPILFFPKPKGMTWKAMAIVGLTTFLGQYVFLFIALKQGMPAGLSSVTLQLQVFVTILFSMVFLGEKPKPRQMIGGAIALAGLGLIASTVGAGSTIPAIAMVCIVLAAVTWAYGNFTMRQSGPDAQFGTLAGVAWVSTIPILPALALSLIFEGVGSWQGAAEHIRPISAAAILYTVVLSTWLGFAIWGRLLSTYTASIAAPFALLVPVFGGLSAFVFLGEILTPLRLAGSLLIFLGLMVILLPVQKLWAAKQTA
jgi:O-acetylserine/cysteine efflux transporter